SCQAEHALECAIFSFSKDSHSTIYLNFTFQKATIACASSNSFASRRACKVFPSRVVFNPRHCGASRERARTIFTRTSQFKSRHHHVELARHRAPTIPLAAPRA
ncbi:MAG TPA: hypothetical protein VIB98_04060, partial [Gemmatimonadaceae bacterium]